MNNLYNKKMSSPKIKSNKRINDTNELSPNTLAQRKAREIMKNRMKQYEGDGITDPYYKLDKFINIDNSPFRKGQTTSNNKISNNSSAQKMSEIPQSSDDFDQNWFEPMENYEPIQINDYAEYIYSGSNVSIRDFSISLFCLSFKQIKFLKNVQILFFNLYVLSCLP